MESKVMEPVKKVQKQSQGNPKPHQLILYRM